MGAGLFVAPGTLTPALSQRERERERGKASRAFAGGSGSGSQGEERPQAGDELVGIGERVGVERTGGGSAGGRALSPRTACSKSRQ